MAFQAFVPSWVKRRVRREEEESHLCLLPAPSYAPPCSYCLVKFQWFLSHRGHQEHAVPDALNQEPGGDADHGTSRPGAFDARSKLLACSTDFPDSGPKYNTPLFLEPRCYQWLPLQQNQAPGSPNIQGLLQPSSTFQDNRPCDSSRQSLSLSFLNRVLFPGWSSCCSTCLEFPVFLSNSLLTKILNFPSRKSSWNASIFLEVPGLSSQARDEQWLPFDFVMS